MEKLVLTKNKLTAIKKSLVNGLTVASGSKTSATYYHSKDEQVKAIQKHVKDLYEVSKELPLIVAAQKGVTGAYATEVLLNELNETYSGGACNIVNPKDWYDEGVGEKALLSVLNNLDSNGITYVLRFFMEVKNRKINNERTRKIVLGYLWGLNNLEFFAVKYRNKIFEVLQHIYGKRTTSILLSIAEKSNTGDGVVTTSKESDIVEKYLMRYSVFNTEKTFKILLFLFKKDEGIEYSATEFPIISQYMKAKQDVTNISLVPEEILIGLLSDENHPQYNQLWSTEEKRKSTMATLRKNVAVTSVNQQVRQTKSTQKLGVEKTVDLSKATDFLALYKTGYENGFTEEILDAIDKLAEKKKFNNFMYETIGIIFDKSRSMYGHKQQSKNTPISIADFTMKVLGKSAKKWIVQFSDTGFNTDLATAFVELMKAERDLEKESNAVFVDGDDFGGKFDAIFVLTDGYENSYEGLFSEVVDAYLTQTNRTLPIFQISPITGAETGADVRKIGDSVFNISVNDPVVIKPQIDAKLLEIDTTLWIENQMKFFKALPLKRYKK